MSALKEARNMFEYSSVWTADVKIMYKDEDDIKFKVYFDLYSGQQKLCHGETEIVFDLDGDLSLFVVEIFTKYSKTISYFVFLIHFIDILPSIKITLLKIQFVHFKSLNITISFMFPNHKSRLQQNINVDVLIVPFNKTLC